MNTAAKKPRGAKSLRPTTERDKMIMSQLWKAGQAARKVAGFTGLNYEELRDVATEYIVKIYDSWDQTKGANFSTWVNRCLSFHMLNYLRDSSRLVKIPRAYSEVYLKIKKLTAANPDMSEEAVAEKLQISVEKLRSVRTAFSMSFAQVDFYQNDYAVTNDLGPDDTVEELLENNSGVIDRYDELPEKDKIFLIDYIVKKRSILTILRKNAHLSNSEDIKVLSQQLLDKILHGP